MWSSYHPTRANLNGAAGGGIPSSPTAERILLMFNGNLPQNAQPTSNQYGAYFCQHLYQEIVTCQNFLVGQIAGPVDFIPNPIVQGYAQGNIITWLPDSLRSVVIHLGAETGFDNLTCTIAVLATISIALCGRFKIQFTQTWQEAVSLYTMLISPSGTKKSSLIQALKDPLEMVMKAKRIDFDLTAPGQKRKCKAQLKGVDGLFNMDMKVKRKACHDPEHGSDYEGMSKHMAELNEQAEPVRKKIQSEMPGARPSLFFNSNSLTGLYKALESQGGHQAAMVGEAGFIEKVITLGPRFNIDLLLEANGQPNFDDSNAHREIQLEYPSLNLFYGIQPMLAAKFYRKNMGNDRGLAPRFIPIFANKNKTYGLYSGNYQNASQSQNDWRGQNKRHFEEFCEMVKRILNSNFTQDPKREIYNLELDHTALASLYNFEAQNSSKSQNGYGHMAAFLGKLHGIAGRIAGILHLWNHYAGGFEMNPISSQTVASGIGIAQAIIPHANHAFGLAGLVGVDPAILISEWIKSARMIYFTYSEAKRGIASIIDKDQVNAGLERLITCCWIGRKYDLKGQPVYVVNPNISGWFTPPPIQQLITSQTVPLGLPAPQQSVL